MVSMRNGTNDATDTHAIATRSTAHGRYVAPQAAQASSRSSCTSLSCSIVSVKRTIVAGPSTAIAYQTRSRRPKR